MLLTSHFAGNVLVTGDNRGVMQYCDEAFRNITIVPGAHNDPIRGLSFSPLDSKLVSCSDDTLLHIWVTGDDEKPERTLRGHQSDVKSVGTYEEAI
jgi:polyadenylation factor subunit 2